MTPFQALYGYEPPNIRSFIPDNPKVQAVVDHAWKTQEVLQIVKENLHMAQNKMKQQEDKRSE